MERWQILLSACIKKRFEEVGVGASWHHKRCRLLLRESVHHLELQFAAEISLMTSVEGMLRRARGFPDAQKHL